MRGKTSRITAQEAIGLHQKLSMEYGCSAWSRAQAHVISRQRLTDLLSGRRHRRAPAQRAVQQAAHLRAARPCAPALRQSHAALGHGASRAQGAPGCMRQSEPWLPQRPPTCCTRQVRRTAPACVRLPGMRDALLRQQGSAWTSGRRTGTRSGDGLQRAPGRACASLTASARTTRAGLPNSACRLAASRTTSSCRGRARLSAAAPPGRASPGARPLGAAGLRSALCPGRRHGRRRRPPRHVRPASRTPPCPAPYQPCQLQQRAGRA
jgi:hypothetical protein